MQRRKSIKQNGTNYNVKLIASEAGNMTLLPSHEHNDFAFSNWNFQTMQLAACELGSQSTQNTVIEHVLPSSKHSCNITAPKACHHTILALSMATNIGNEVAKTEWKMLTNRTQAFPWQRNNLT